MDTVGEFMCEACVTTNDEMLYQHYLMLTPDARRLADRCVDRMLACRAQLEGADGN